MKLVNDKDDNNNFFHFSDWSNHVGIEMPFDSSIQTLQLRTGKKVDEETITIYFISETGIGGFEFNPGTEDSPPKYKFTHCHHDAIKLLEPLPGSKVKVWTLKWDPDQVKFTLFCNGKM